MRTEEYLQLHELSKQALSSVHQINSKQHFMNSYASFPLRLIKEKKIDLLTLDIDTVTLIS